MTTGVAPYVGAWIETRSALAASSLFWSHPTWVRGLKPQVRQTLTHLHVVAPYVGAWIETGASYQNQREE